MMEHAKTQRYFILGGRPQMFDFLRNLFDTTDFPARWDCGKWSLGHGSLHIGSDIAIFGAYTAIPLVLAFFIFHRKDDIPFPRVMWLFVAFIFACGSVHLIEAVIFWHPIYRFSGVVKLTTALVSWGTVIALVDIVPRALHLPGIARMNSQLMNEVEMRKRTEDALRHSEDKLARLLQSEREARADAERANRIKDEFLSTVSHELRTPLNAILGYSQLLHHSLDDHREMEEGLSVIERNAKAQSQIIEDLLDMGRILSGKVRLDVQSVDMAEVIEAAVDTLQPAADAKNIRVQCVLDSRAGTVLGDDSRLQQVIWNLLANSIKFTPKGGRVQVSLVRINSHFEISVSDSGAGIPPDLLPHVFDRFRQGDASTTKRYGGLGLGLSIVKQLVELHGGTVSASSPGEGQGATITIELPVQIVQGREILEQMSHAAEVGHAAEIAQVSLEGIRVLVVDDEPDSRELARRLLSKNHATVEVAEGVDEAMALFQANPPDVLLSDIGMPHKDGYELMRAIRALGPPAGTVPAIALTALARPEDRKRAMLAGFQAHVSKPVDPGELIAVVATFAGRTGR
jgi:signal transduction histidine kinase/ActR/RegA family two-component response regulator